MGKVLVRVDRELLKQLRDMRPELAGLKDAPLVNLILREALTASRSPPLKRREGREE
ncbi:hypothetical protein J7L97_02535 [Candidatus Bathyarchaeota archaeon]|nr:hypothetical protein [Candidatus Bathyarchaeota archaeon]